MGGVVVWIIQSETTDGVGGVGSREDVGEVGGVGGSLDITKRDTLSVNIHGPVEASRVEALKVDNCLDCAGNRRCTKCTSCSLCGMRRSRRQWPANADAKHNKYCQPGNKGNVVRTQVTRRCHVCVATASSGTVHRLSINVYTFIHS